MCLESPAQVVSVDPDGLCAMVRAERGTQPALLLALDPKSKPIQSGDWLVVHSGLAVELISENEAHDLLDLMGQSTSTEEVR
jgi:hydrogenase assembly chaperone HypC/HupF